MKITQSRNHMAHPLREPKINEEVTSFALKVVQEVGRLDIAMNHLQHGHTRIHSSINMKASEGVTFFEWMRAREPRRARMYRFTSSRFIL